MNGNFKLVVCNIESLSEQHRRFCEQARRYVSPIKRYIDDDGLTHDPSYHLPTYNPENYTRSGMYILDFLKKYKEDHMFRNRMKNITKINLGLD